MSVVPALVATRVDMRDQWCCRRCGIRLSIVEGSRHHRQRRAAGGHVTSNIILLCGSGTTLCHGWVHAHPEVATMRGFIVPANGRARSLVIPLLSRGQWWLLDDVGGQELIPEATALETLAAFGMRIPGGGS